MTKSEDSFRDAPPTDDGQEYLDRDKLDFDPDDGLLSGTAIDGTSDIPGPHADPETGDIDINADTDTDTDTDTEQAEA